MPVVESTITVDFHITEDTDLDTVQAVVRENQRVSADLAQRLRRTVETNATDALEANDLEDYELSLDVDLVTGRLPGAPRERITAALDVDGESSVLAAVDEAISTPQRAEIADAVEAVVLGYLGEHDLAGGVEIIVSVTPIQFR